MPDLDAIAARHDVPPDAARHLLDALARGQGRMAQFDHPALGGMGQWHAGGMTMVGDMFDDALKARVAALCADLAPLVTEAQASRPTAGAEAGWPAELGAPSSSGSQNGARYGVFPAARRLVVIAEGRTTTYDTGDHVIGGVSQQQGPGRDLRFTSRSGPVDLHDLREVSGSGASTPDPEPAPPRATPATGAADDPLGTLERLADLHGRGILTDEEFGRTKAELLARL